MYNLFILCCVTIFTVIYAIPVTNDANFFDIIQKNFPKECPTLSSNVLVNKSTKYLSKCNHVSILNAPKKIDVLTLDNYYCIGILAANFELCKAISNNTEYKSLPKDYNELEKSMNQVMTFKPEYICNSFKNFTLFNGNAAIFSDWTSELNNKLKGSKCVPFCSDLAYYDNGVNLLCSMLYYINYHVQNIANITNTNTVIQERPDKMKQPTVLSIPNQTDRGLQAMPNDTNTNNTHPSISNENPNAIPPIAKAQPIQKTNTVNTEKHITQMLIKGKNNPDVLEPQVPVTPPITLKNQTLQDHQSIADKPSISNTINQTVATAQNIVSSTEPINIESNKKDVPNEIAIQQTPPKQNSANLPTQNTAPVSVGIVTKLSEPNKETEEAKHEVIIATTAAAAVIRDNLEGVNEAEYDDDLEDKKEVDDDLFIPDPNNTPKEQMRIGVAGSTHNDDSLLVVEDSNFFSYFMFISVMFIAGYVVYHNKQKIMALVLEGRRDRNSRRRPSTSSYRKLNSNLEEAVTSKCSGSASHVIY